jgi:hypothetical protein
LYFPFKLSTVKEPRSSNKVGAAQR